MKLKKLASLALAGALTLGLLPALSAPALADVVTTTDYVLTIPSSLTVTKSGWNKQTDGITAKLSRGDAFDDSKKLTVTAASNNKDTNAEYEWKLVSDTNTVGYNLAASGDDNSSYNSTATPASWEFSASEITTAGTKKTLGIIVDDYSSKPAGTYTDIVTFTAAVESAVPEYYNKLTKINDSYDDQVYLLKLLGRGRQAYNSSLTAAQAYALATYQAAIDGKPVYVIMSSQGDGYEIHYALSTDAAATEHTSDLYRIGNDSNPVRMYYIAQ